MLERGVDIGSDKDVVVDVPLQPLVDESLVGFAVAQWECVGQAPLQKFGGDVILGENV